MFGTWCMCFTSTVMFGTCCICVSQSHQCLVLVVLAFHNYNFRRIISSKWVSQVWEVFVMTQDAEETEYCNYLCGWENDFVKLHRSFEYQDREKDSKKTEPLSPEEIEEWMQNDRMLRKERNVRRRRRRMRNMIELSLKKRENYYWIWNLSIFLYSLSLFLKIWMEIVTL